VAERLGEAILELRTDDAAFNTGLARAEGQAQKLGSTLDKATGSSARLAGEMIQGGKSAEQMSRGFEQAGRQVEASAGAQRAAMQNLGFQLNDVATGFALGLSPMQIFAQQGGQIIQILGQMAGASAQSGTAAGEAGSDIEGLGDKTLEAADKAKDMGGKIGAVAGFLSGPWGIAISVAVIALSPFIGKLFESEDALDAVAFASDKLGDAQGILGSVMDRTTLQITAQSEALVVLARAQAAAGRVGALQRQADARSALQDIRQGGLGDLRVEGSLGGARIVRANRGQDVVDLYLNNRLSASAAEAQLRARANNGIISQEDYFRAAQAITGDAVEGANVKLFEDTQSALSGDGAAARRIFGAQGSGRARSPRGGGSAGPRARTAAEQQGDFDSQSYDLERQTLQARLSLATSAQDRADLQRDLLSLERQQQVAEIEATDLTRDMKDALIAQVEALLGREPQFDEQGNLIVSANRGLEGEIIARELAVRQLEEAQGLADERFRGETEALQNALALADTEAERKAIALRLLEAEEEFERIRLQTIISAAETEEAERARAALALANLEANSSGRRAGVARQNETEVERYLRSLNQTPAQINEALDGISIDGLETLNEGLVDAITGAESLGDVFSRVADQIIADLLRIAIQRAIIAPLADALFGGGGGGAGGGGGGLFGTIASAFAGFFATGGTIPTGQFGIVGENGPELAVAGPGGLGILSNADSGKLLSGGAGGTSVSIPISIDATGADPAALGRVTAEIKRLKAELPGMIVTTVQDADNRRILSLRGGR
jgi:hypothetical protein